MKSVYPSIHLNIYRTSFKYPKYVREYVREDLEISARCSECDHLWEEVVEIPSTLTAAQRSSEA
jgi:hypothetical protein